MKDDKLGTTKLGTTTEFSKFPIFPGNESKQGPKVKLNQICDRFNDHYLIEDFVTTVGSIVNWGETTGDIDILIKAEEGSDLFELEKWRILRAFPEFAERFHFTEFGLWKGPFTDHVHLLDLKAQLSPHFREIHLMSKFPGFRESATASKEENKVIPLRPCFLLKPMHGRKKEEQYTPDSVIRVMNSLWKDWQDPGVYVEKKHDGVHVQVHKKGENVLIISEDGQDYTNVCTTITAEIKTQTGDFVAAGEIELWKDGKHQPRADTAGVLNSKEPHEDEEDLRINIFDLLSWSDSIG